jgi:opacity protein-like surface antigen
MKKIAVILLILSTSAFSQISLKLGPVIGLTSPTSDYTGDTKDFYAGTKYGMRSGINFGAMGKLQFGPLNGRISVVYSSLSNDGVGDPNFPNSSLEISNNLVMFTIGTEFGFGIPFSPVKPYAGIDLLFSSISGTFRFQGLQNVNSNENSIKSSSRTGLGFAIGSEISFGKTFTADISLRYNLINLFGKEYTNVTNANRIDSYTSLNDDADPNYSASDDKHPIANSRQIATIQLQFGILFGF